MRGVSRTFVLISVGRVKFLAITEEWLLANTSIKPKKHGVRKKGKKFQAKLDVEKERFYLGYYNTEAEAADVARLARQFIQTGGILDDAWKRKHCSLPNLVKV